jgi:hypothetical protein
MRHGPSSAATAWVPRFQSIQLTHVSCGVAPTRSERRTPSSANCEPSNLLEGLQIDATCGSLPARRTAAARPSATGPRFVTVVAAAPNAGYLELVETLLLT